MKATINWIPVSAMPEDNVNVMLSAIYRPMVFGRKGEISRCFLLGQHLSDSQHFPALERAGGWRVRDEENQYMLEAYEDCPAQLEITHWAKFPEQPPIDFPENPTLGDRVNHDGQLYEYKISLEGGGPAWVEGDMSPQMQQAKCHPSQCERTGCPGCNPTK